MADLPFGFRFSTLATLSSGAAYQVTDGSRGSDSGAALLTAAYPEKNCIKGLFAFCEVNVSLAKDIKIARGNVEAAVDILNLFNNKNFKDFDTYMNPASNPPDLLLPADAAHAANTLTLPRRIQFRLGYRF